MTPNLALDKSPQDVLNKADVAESFSRAAASYDAAAELQRLVGDRLMTHLPAESAGDFKTILDLGSGTGFYTLELARRFPQSRLYALDIAMGMLEFAKHRNGCDRIRYCCGDAEQLPLTSASVELIFSNLAVQWCPNMPGMFDEAWRVLAPGGKMIFSTLGPATLHELKSAWNQVDNYVHVNRFAGLNQVVRSARQAGFDCVTAEQQLQMNYRSLRELIHSLKAIGAHNVNSGRPGGLTGRQKIGRLKLAYEKFRRRDGLLPATYQVFYLVLTKPGRARSLQQI